MAVVPVQMPATRAPLISSTEKQSWYENISVTDWEIVSRNAPTGAISFEEREAPEYDEEAVKEAQKKISAKNQAISAHTGCPGSRIMQIQRTETPETDQSPSTGPQISRLRNWPVQIKLAPFMRLF